MLGALPATTRERIALSPISSGSHAKILLYDGGSDGAWETIIGSCNFLSSPYNAIDISVRSRSQRLAAQILSRLIAAQLPVSGGWNPLVHGTSCVALLRHRKLVNMN
jgi:hypothetical protein